MSNWKEVGNNYVNMECVKSIRIKEVGKDDYRVEVYANEEDVWLEYCDSLQAARECVEDLIGKVKQVPRAKA